MLTLLGGLLPRSCDGFTRRNFIKVGALSFGATTFTLADLFRAEASAKTKNPYPPTRQKALINIFLGGGPPHQDMWDVKTEAPSDIRGEFKPIATKVPGIQIGECFPKIAAMADKFAFLRSVVGARGGHDGFQCMTGWDKQSLSSLGGRPSIGAVAAKLQGNVDPAVPPFVGLAEMTRHVPWSDPGQVGFLGSIYSSFKPAGPDLANMVCNPANRTYLAERKAMLEGFDNLRRDLDFNGTMRGMDANTIRALDVLTSSKLVDALDLSKEDPRERAQYGDGKPFNYQYDGAPTVNEHLLVARRLVEAGARVVSLSYGRWDSHSKNFDLVRDHGAKLDRCLTTLVNDLDERGMLDDTTVIAWGEFGRTPRINKEGGRDHWPQVSCAILAGGGMKTGQVIGSTNRLGEFAKDRPVTFGEIFATLYQNLGINPETTTVMDPTGRPQHLVDGVALPELI